MEIYTAPNEAELADYFIGDHPPPSVGCTDFSVTVNGVTQRFSNTRVDLPPIAPHATLAQYSVTQDGSTTHQLRVTAVSDFLAASIILPTAEPTDQTMTDAVLRITQQAIS